MVEINLYNDINVECDACGKPLKTYYTDAGNGLLTVEPCDDCLDQAHKDGKDS